MASELTKDGAAIVVAGGLNTQTDPAIAGLAGGGFALVWDGTPRLLVTQAFGQEGEAAGAATEIGISGGYAFGETLIASIDGLADGGYAVSYTDNSGFAPGEGEQGGSFFLTRLRIYDENGVGQSSVLLSPSPSSHYSSVVGVTDGGYFAAWDQIFEHEDHSIHSSRGIVSTEMEESNIGLPSADVLESGETVTVWIGDGVDGDRVGIQGRVGSGAQFTVNSTTFGDQYLHYGNRAVAALEGGGFAVVFEDRGDLNTPRQILVRVFDADGRPLGSDIRVNGLEGSHFNPEIAALEGGGFVVAWEDRSGAGAMMAQQFDAAGNKAGDAVEVASGTASNVTVTSLADGRLAFAWETYDSATGKYGVQAQAYEIVEVTLGTEGADTLLGTPEPDTIRGLGGDDTIGGMASDDRIEGGAGNDTIAGGDGNDGIDGGDGDDLIGADAGNDVIEGGDGADALLGEEGADTLAGGAGNDLLNGGANPEGETGQGDVMLGGDGDDAYFVDSGLDLVDEGSYFAGFGHGGSDTIISTTDFYWDIASVGESLAISEDVVDAGGDGVTIVGSVFANTMLGHSGSDVMFGRGGADVYKGGDGVDWISLSLLGVEDAEGYTANGANTIIVEPRENGAFSYDIVFEFETGKDRLDVSAYAAVNGFTSGADVLARGVNVDFNGDGDFDDGSDSSYFILGDGLDYLYMVGTTLDEIAAGDFIV